MSGINYPASLTKHVAEEAENSKIVKDQKADPKRNVLTGEHFGTENVKGNVNMDSLITIDEQKLARAFAFDQKQARQAETAQLICGYASFRWSF